MQSTAKVTKLCTTTCAQQQGCSSWPCRVDGCRVRSLVVSSTSPSKLACPFFKNGMEGHASCSPTSQTMFTRLVARPVASAEAKCRRASPVLPGMLRLAARWVLIAVHFTCKQPDMNKRNICALPPLSWRSLALDVAAQKYEQFTRWNQPPGPVDARNQLARCRHNKQRAEQGRAISVVHVTVGHTVPAPIISQPCLAGLGRKRSATIRVRQAAAKPRPAKLSNLATTCCSARTATL